MSEEQGWTRARLFSALGLLAAIAFATAFFTLGIGALRRSTHELVARLDGVEETVLARLDAVERELQRSSSGVALPTAGEEYELLREIDALAATAASDALRKVLRAYLDRFADSEHAPVMRKMQQELEVMGRPAPPAWAIDQVFQGPHQAGLTEPGTKVILFWEVWCPHCRREAPRLQEVYAALKGRGLAIVALTRVSGAATEEEVRAFIEEEGIGYAVAKEDGTVSEHFGVTGVPAAAVISDGTIVWRGHPARLSSELLEEWL